MSKLSTRSNSTCWVTFIQSSNLSTSNRAFCAKPEEPKQVDSFAKYEKSARAEDFHFDKKGQKLGMMNMTAEAKTKEIISKSSADNNQGMFKFQKLAYKM